MSFNRRSFIRYASLAAAGNLAGMRPFGMMNGLAQASAQSANDYKALVCIFLYGGNDSNNTLIPFDTAGYANYSNLRGPLALSQNSLLQLGPTPHFALHPSLGEIQTLFNGGNAAFVANVGTLVQPLTRTQYLNGQLKMPSNLFSHSDQQMEWQNAAQSAVTATGWAGRIADKLAPVYNAGAQIPLITSVDGDSLFCNGARTSPVAVSAGNIHGGRCSEDCGPRSEAAQQLVTFNSGIALVQADNAITNQAYTYMQHLTAAVQTASSALQTPFPANNGLAAQLKQIAQIIQVRQALGVKRQIFFAGLGNFDTHADQLGTQASLLSQVSPAMLSFYQAMQELGVSNNVTSFTMSDFSRALQPNSNNGSDHAWGGHHIVMGGAVNGGQIYGTYPTLALGGPNDSGTNGRWVPTTASAQYAATLASWFGVQNSDLASVFPTLGNFSTANLGFVG